MLSQAYCAEPNLNPCLLNFVDGLILRFAAADIGLHHLTEFLVERIKRVVNRQIAGFFRFQNLFHLLRHIQVRKRSILDWRNNLRYVGEPALP